jgi:16S rRNA (uracil1498-N3)-methyltransferase
MFGTGNVDYFYVKPEDVTGNAFVLRGEESKHLARVLRKHAGERIFATDGNDHMYEAFIAEIGKKDTHCRIGAVHTKYNEPSLNVALAVSLLKNPARFDSVVEKATELGVRHIIPMRCERTVPHREKRDRLEKIAVAAVKQCGRSWLPRISSVTKLNEVLAASGGYGLRIITHEKADLDQTVEHVLGQHPQQNSILILIGPEGGFSDEEVKAAKDAGFVAVTLGSRRLRTETAALAAATLVVK